jgi:hypothetical protein
VAIISFGTQANYQTGDTDAPITRAAYDALAKNGHASDKEFCVLLDSSADGQWDTAYELGESGANSRFTILNTHDTSIDPVSIIGTDRISDSAVGMVPSSDLDQGHMPFRPKVAGAQGNVGTLNLQANGSCTIAMANSTMQYLGASGGLLLFT